jgi:hypothetical protein
VKRNFKLRLALIAVLAVTLALTAGGCGGGDAPPKEDDVPAEVRGLILTYLSDIQETIGAGDVYFARTSRLNQRMETSASIASNTPASAFCTRRTASPTEWNPAGTGLRGWMRMTKGRSTGTQASRCT